MEKITLSDGKERILLDTKKDDCLICGTPLKDVYFEWGIMHGNATTSCCNTPHQIKDYYIDPEKHPKDVVEYVKKLGGGRIEFSVKKEWIEPLKKAIEKTGIRNINDDTVLREAHKLLSQLENK